MAREPVFYSFHFDNDVFRVQQVRNMGVIEGDEPVSANEWEQLKRRSGGVERWIDDNMKYKRCVVVLIGSETASRPWVKYEIKKAWNDGRGLVGIYIHNLKCLRTRTTCSKGINPFANFTVDGQSMANLVTCHDPNSWDAYADIKDNLEYWVADAIARAKRR
ncbi:TIR domain-containing protein [Peristeroidobacter soli]|uniref:TIR domain-containing protein n=1 Tax=Peristeroidobacter soli TaxID=2497877 RepID=UPI00101CF195|nr:TIR domain-containing protein [Peristeroidobacter soli]